MLPAPMDEHPTAAIPPRPRLIVPANNSITAIPPTPPHTPLLNPVNPVNPVQNFYMFYTAEIGYWQGEGLTTEDGGQRIAVRPARPTVSVYSVYFVVQISASFAFFAANHSQKG